MSDKIKFELEFPIQASSQLLFQYISTPSGLSEWFADNVNLRGELFTFIWDDSEEQAKLLTKKNGERVKFKWLDDDTNSYFEIRIQVEVVLTAYVEEQEFVDEFQRCFYDNGWMPGNFQVKLNGDQLP